MPEPDSGSHGAHSTDLLARFDGTAQDHGHVDIRLFMNRSSYLRSIQHELDEPIPVEIIQLRAEVGKKRLKIGGHVKRFHRVRTARFKVK